MKRQAQACAFTLVEALIILAAMAVVGTVVVNNVSGLRQSASEQKLEKDIATINSGVDAYRASGGTVPTNATAQQVIDLLKTRSASASAARTLGLTGSFIDPRTVLVLAEGSGNELRARWDGESLRFVTERGAGDIAGFDLDELAGAAAPVTEERERTLDQATADKWVWDYSDVEAPVRREALVPGTVEGSDTSLVGGGAVVQLDLPTFEPAGGSPTPLLSFPLSVSIANPNPQGSSRIYYSVNGAQPVLYTGSFPVDPGDNVSAIAVSLDASRYKSSGNASTSYPVDPLQLAVSIDAPTTLTYAQAVDAVFPPFATVTLQSDIPPEYISSQFFEIVYTTDGSDPLAPGSAAVGPQFAEDFVSPQISIALPAWGPADQLVIKAAARAKNSWFLDSGVAEVTVRIEPTPLNVVILPANPIGLPPVVQMQATGSDVPASTAIFYTLDGTPPLSAELGGEPADGVSTYAGPFNPGQSSTYTITAQAFVPGLAVWFSSAPASRTYSAVTVLNPDFVGANISGGDVNGTFRGSIFVSAPADLGIFNAGGQIVNGNLYVPGLPAIDIPGSGNETKTVVEGGAYFNQSESISRSLIAGKELSADGVLADPQLDTRQIVDLNGSGSPTNYTIKLTKNSFIEGKIYRNVDVPPPPPVPVAPAGLSPVTNSFTGVPAAALASGIYSNNITMNSDASILRLGVSGATTPTQYIFGGNTFNKGTVEILGPVEIYFTTGWTNSGVVFGGTNVISQLRINVLGGDVDLKSGGAVYASLWATNAISVGNGGILFGNIYAQTLDVAPGGTVNVEPQP